MLALPPIPAATEDEVEEDNCSVSSEELARKQFSSLQRVITISYDNLNRLRHEASSSFVREEIKTLEGKLVRLFYRQMTLQDSQLEPDMDLWLNVVGLSEATVECLLERNMKLQDSVEHIDSVKAAMKQLKASDEDIRRLCMALHNIRIYQERCANAEGGKQPQWQDLHWESWTAAHKHHGSISSSGTINSTYACYSDSGMNYSSYRHSSDGASIITHHRPSNLSYSSDTPLRPLSDSGTASYVYRKWSDSGGGGCAILPWESDGGYSTPSSPSFLEGPISYSNLSVHSVVNNRHKKSTLQRSNTLSLGNPTANPSPINGPPLHASVHSLPVHSKHRKWYAFKKARHSPCSETAASNGRHHSHHSLRSLDFERRNRHSIDTYCDLRVKTHRVRHHKSIVPKVCCLCSRSIFYGIKCCDCGARYHEACYYQAGASFRAVHPEVHSKRDSWIVRFFRRSSTEESQGLSSSSDSGLCIPDASLTSASGCRSGSSTTSTPNGNTSHFFPSSYPLPTVDVHNHSIQNCASSKGPKSVVGAHSSLTVSTSLPSQWGDCDTANGAYRHASGITDVPEEPSTSSSRCHLPQTLGLISSASSSTLNNSNGVSSSQVGLDSTVSTLSESYQSTINDEHTLCDSEISNSGGDYVSSSGSSETPSAQQRRYRSTMRSSLVTEWEIRMEEIQMLEMLPPGRFGTVYKGNWHGECAVRIFHKELISSTDVIAFRKEVQLMKKTRHENIALFMAAVVRPPDLAFVTAFIKGKSLFQLIHMEGERFAAEAVRPIAKQITQGMAYLHARGIVHRDLKSRNVFIDSTGHIVISDFAMSAALLSCDTKERKYRHEKHGLDLRRGFLQYLAPELIRQINVADTHMTRLSFNQSTDIFAFGTVIYECMQGWPCSKPEIHTQLYLAGTGKMCVDGASSNITEFRDMIRRAWSMDPSDRLNFTHYEHLIGRFPRKLHQGARGPSFPMVCMEANF